MEILAIFYIGLFVLQVIFLYKIWGMTNDVRHIKNHLLKKSYSVNLSKDNEANSKLDKMKFKIGDLVVNTKTGKQMRISEIDVNMNQYLCTSNRGLVNEGSFSDQEIKHFD